MPLFDLKCKKCGSKQEQLLEEYQEVIVYNCNNCTYKYHEVLPPLVSMHPDKFWSGVNTEQGYVTSKTQHQQILKEKGLERIEKGMFDQVKKKAKNRIPETLEKNAKKAEKWLANELKNA